MNAELKAKWVSALRSGEYEQTIGALRRGTAERFYYCCLGVLYCIEGKEKVPSKPTPETSALSRWEMDEPTRILLEGMNDGGLTPDGKQLHRHSFAEIAEWIEANL